MPEDRHFNDQELEIVDRAVLQAEELVNNYYKMSSGQWLKNRYDIKTAKDLAAHERVAGPVAQVVKYEGRNRDNPFGSTAFSLYTVCLQDPAILRTVAQESSLMLEPFLLYVLTHELIHVVRFSRFEHRYENGREADVTLAEEQKVHGLTHDILHAVCVPGLFDVFAFYGEWRDLSKDDSVGKKKG